MNVITPLCDINYYKLELDNLNISSDLILEVNKIIKLNLSSQNIINHIVKLIKKK